MRKQSNPAWGRSAQSLLLGIWLLVAAASGRATDLPTLKIDPLRAEQAMDSGLWIIADPDDAFAAVDVRAGRHDAQGRLLTGRSVPLGYPRHAYWARFALHNPTSEADERLLVLWRGSKHSHQLWIDLPDAAQYLVLGPGAEAPSGDLRSRHAVARLTLPPGATAFVTVRLQTRFSTHLDYRWMRESALAAHEWRDQAMFGGLAGFCLAVGAFVLLLGLASRESSYQWFALAAWTTAIYMLSFEGSLSVLYAPLGLGEDILRLVSGGAGVVSIAAVIQFARRLLDTTQQHPTLDRVLLRPTAIAGIVLWAAMLVWPDPFLQWVALWALLAVLLLTGSMLWIALRRRLDLPGFVIATCLYLLVTAIYVLQLLGLMPDQPAVHLFRILSLALCLLLFAFIVSEKFRRARLAQEQAIRRNEAHLEQMVSERTTELSEAKRRAESALQNLQVAQVELVAAEKMASLGQLVAGVAHEINTPLGVALTASSHLGEQTRELRRRIAEGALKRSELDNYADTASEASRLLQVNLDRAAELVRNFKQVSVDRTSDGRRSFALAEFIEALLDSLSPVWKRRSVKLEVKCDPALWMDSFPGALGQVLTNLIQNALLHAFPDDRAGLIRIQARTADDGRIELRVRDDGVGIAAEHLGRLFEPFFTTRRGQGGTGLGLHIAFNLVTQKLGGSLQVHSAPGQGSAFVLHLPVRAP